MLLRAEGRSFSGGVDVHVFDGLTPEQGSELWESLFARICHPIEALPCPVVFAAHGLTLTAAFEIALACDIVVAGPKARFGLGRRLSPSLRRWVARSGWPKRAGSGAPGNW